MFESVDFLTESRKHFSLQYCSRNPYFRKYVNMEKPIANCIDRASATRLHMCLFLSQSERQRWRYSQDTQSVPVEFVITKYNEIVHLLEILKYVLVKAESKRRQSSFIIKAPLILFNSISGSAAVISAMKSQALNRDRSYHPLSFGLTSAKSKKQISPPPLHD